MGIVFEGKCYNCENNNLIYNSKNNNFECEYCKKKFQLKDLDNYSKKNGMIEFIINEEEAIKIAEKESKKRKFFNFRFLLKKQYTIEKIYMPILLVDVKITGKAVLYFRKHFKNRSLLKRESEIDDIYNVPICCFEPMNPYIFGKIQNFDYSSIDFSNSKMMFPMKYDLLENNMKIFEEEFTREFFAGLEYGLTQSFVLKKYKLEYKSIKEVFVPIWIINGNNKKDKIFINRSKWRLCH